MDLRTFRVVLALMLSMAASCLLGQSMADSSAGAGRLIRTHDHSTLQKGMFKAGIDWGTGLNLGSEDALFGLDNGDLRLAVDYAPKDRFQLGAGYSVSSEILDVYAKYATWQEKHVQLAFVAGMYMDASPWEEAERTNYFTSRSAYNFQAIASKAFGNTRVQLVPGLFHRNLTFLSVESHDVFNVSVGLTQRLNASLELIGEYNYVPEGQLLERYGSSYAAGIRFNANLHWVKLWAGNSSGVQEWDYLTRNDNAYTKAGPQLGLAYKVLF